MRKEGVLKKNLVWAMCNCMVSMATQSEFEKGCLPTELLISQLLLILDTWTTELNTKLKLRHRPIIPLLHMGSN